MIVMITLCTLFILGGWLPPFNLAILYWLPGGFWFGIEVVLLVTYHKRSM